MSRSDRIMVAAGGSALVLVAAAAWMLLSPAVAEAPPAEREGAVLVTSSEAAVASPAGSPGSTLIVVDVQGAVARTGVRELPAGARVADAIEAAGGYAADADLVAAASSINLAAPLTDGGQVRVPRVGEAIDPARAAPAASSVVGAGAQGGGSSGQVDLNTATPEELEALPGIGPVTVQKIVAARQEQPFVSLQDAVDRGVLHRGQLEDIQGLATAG